MKNNKGITLVSLVFTVILLGILMALLINIKPFNELIQVKNVVEDNFNDIRTQTDEKVNSIKDQWEGVI